MKHWFSDEMEKMIANMALDLTMKEYERQEEEKCLNQIKTLLNNLIKPPRKQINGLTAGAYRNLPADVSSGTMQGFNVQSPLFELEISKNVKAEAPENIQLAPVPQTAQPKLRGYAPQKPELRAKTDINPEINNIPPFELGIEKNVPLETQKNTQIPPMQNNMPQTTKPANQTGPTINQNTISSNIPRNNKNKVDLRLPDFIIDKANDFNQSIDELKDKTKSYVLKTFGKFAGNMTAREYYGLSANLGDNEKPTRKMRKTNDFYKLKDIGRQDLHRFMAEKIAKAENLDINNPDDYKQIEDFDIVVPKNNSKLAAIIQKSPKMEEFIRQNYDKIKNGDFQKSVQSIEFPYEDLKEFKKLKELWRPEGLNDIHLQEDLDKLNLFATIHRADLYDMKINPDGSLTYILNDHYDFDPAEHDKNKSGLYNRIIDANNIAVEQLKNKEIRPYQILRPVTIPKEELIRILQGL